MEKMGKGVFVIPSRKTQHDEQYKRAEDKSRSKVLIKGKDKNKGNWDTEIVEELFKGKDNAIRDLKL